MPWASTQSSAKEYSLINYANRAIYDYEGTINKFLVDDKGSTLIAVFGLPPLAHENDGTRAVLAGKFLVESLAKIDMEARVGISSGIGQYW